MVNDKRNEVLKSLKGFAKMSLDFSFKRVFGNESNKGALIAFLNRVIGGVEIEDVQLLPTERLGLTFSDRKTVFDVFCRSKDGTESYGLREDTTNEVMNDKLRFIFLELGRFDKKESELSDMNDKWMYALKHMHEFSDRPDELMENELDVLFNLARIANFTPKDVDLYIDELIMERDYWNCLDYAKEEAMKEGLEQGLNEAARRMLASGMSVEQIAAIMNFSEDQVKAM